MKPLYREIADDVANKITAGEFRQGQKLPTEAELSLIYRVSRVTVRNAMQILADERRIYKIAGSGTFVGSFEAAELSKSGGNPLVGVILCNFSASYGAELLKGLEKNIAAAGFTVALINSHYDRETETQAIKTLAGLKVKGIIIQPVHDEAFNTELMRLSLAGFPFVLLDRDLPGLSLPFVGSDNARAVEDAVKFILERGHRDVCMFTPVSLNTFTIEERIKAFEKASVYGGLSKRRRIFSELESPLVDNPDKKLIEKDVRATEEFLRLNPQITCAFASEYSIARIVRMAARNMGKTIPDELSLMTFDNHNDPFRSNSTTFIRQREDEIARRAVETMLSYINGEPDKRRYYIQTDLIDNGSVIENGAAKEQG